MALIRLDKFLSNRTPYSRTELRRMMLSGAVLVDGAAETSGSRKIDPELQQVTCLGKRVRGSEFVYCILNKPAGFVCSTDDPDNRTVLELVPEELRVKGLAPAGRLDGDSTGLVVLTNDGTLTHRMLSPKHHVPKHYLVQLARPYEPGYAAQFAAGLALADGTQCLPAEIVPLDVPGEYCVVCLHEGKYHQVKRMAAAVGNHVVHLHRIAVGGLLLPPNLTSGTCMEILHKDVESLLKPCPTAAVCSRLVSDFSSYLINEGL